MFRTSVHLTKLRQLNLVKSMAMGTISFAPTKIDICRFHPPSASLSSGLEVPLSGPPPRQSRHLFRKMFLALFGSSAIAFGLLYTSKYFRDLLTDQYPPAKPVLARIEGLIGGWYDEQTSKPVVDSPEEDSSLPFLLEKFDTPAEVSPEPSVVETPPETRAERGTSELPTFDDVVQMTQERARAVPATKPSVDISKAVSDATHSVQAAIISLQSLSTATRNHIEGLREAMRTSGETVRSKEKKWEHVSRLAALKDKAETRASEAVQDAREHLDKLRDAVHQFRETETALDSDLFPQAVNSCGKLRYELDGAVLEVRKLQNELSMLMRYRDLASKTHEALQKDLEDIHEQTDLNKVSKDGSSLSVGELNSLIVVAHNQIGQLKTLLVEAEEKEKARLFSALESQRRDDERLIADYLERELEQERNDFQIQRFNWELEAREATERELRRARSQYSEHLSHILRLKEDQLEHQFAARLREALAQEKVAFEAALSGWTQRMKAIEDVVEGRAELDRIAKETQALWIACESLACNLSSGTPTVGDPLSRSKTTGPLSDYLDAIKEAASSGSHPFVLAVLQQIPAEASDQGVWVERGLKERFEKVYRVCKRVALIDETGASLYTYALSWLQSVLTLDLFTHKYLRRWLNSTPSNDLTGDSELTENVKPSELDTFCLLRSAKAALAVAKVPSEDDDDERTLGGEGLDDGIELAVRLLGQLRGQARLVAADWLKDARQYLETKQAAQVLLAYAAARGMSSFEKRL